MTTDEIIEAARTLADELAADILKARTREDHIVRVTRANSALALANGLVEQVPDQFAQDREVVGR
jgi:hypothetical protein